jgi:DNA-binding NarL/FixJ family response regulator
MQADDTRKWRILVADRFPVIRAGLRRYIEERPMWNVVAEAEDGSEAIRSVVEMRPDLAVLSARLPVMDGLAVTSKLQELAPEAEVLIFATNVDGVDVREALNAGARGYVLKSDGKDQLVAGIEAVIQHKQYLSAKASRLLSALPDQGRRQTSLLTERQRDVLQLIAEGRLNKEIARDLGVGLKTVETHRTALMRKLDASSAAALVRYAVRAGIIEP